MISPNPEFWWFQSFPVMLGCPLDGTSPDSQRSQTLWGRLQTSEKRAHWSSLGLAVSPELMKQLHMYPSTVWRRERRSIQESMGPWDWYIYLHECLMLMVNVSKYTIHGSYGSHISNYSFEQLIKPLQYQIPQNIGWFKTGLSSWRCSKSGSNKVV